MSARSRMQGPSPFFSRPTTPVLPMLRCTSKPYFSSQSAAIPAVRTSCIDSSGFRSEEHTSELQSLMRISYAVFCLKKKKQYNLIDKTNLFITYKNAQTKLMSAHQPTQK